MIKRTSCFFQSSIGLKFIMGVTGFLLCLFLLLHVSGNLLILLSPDLFNEYSFSLTHNKAFLYSAEGGLLAVFLIHIAVAIRLTLRNRMARPVRYQQKRSTGLSRRSWFSQNMIITGFFLIYFVVIHLLDFRFGEVKMTTIHGVAMRDLAASVFSEFHELEDTIFYVIAILVLMMHLVHGVRSAFATVGAEHPRYARPLKCLSYLFVIGVGCGFIIIPFWIHFFGA